MVITKNMARELRKAASTLPKVEGTNHYMEMRSIWAESDSKKLASDALRHYVMSVLSDDGE